MPSGPVSRDKGKSSEPASVDHPDFVERLKQYDAEAYRELFQTLHDRIYNLAYRLTRNSEDAEEILQEAFFSVFDKIHTFQGKSRLTTWIYAIASNAALSRLRKKDSQAVTFNEESNLNQEGALFRNPVSFDIQKNDPVIVKELQERLEQAIDELPDGYREIFIMKEIEKMPIKEIAPVFNINPGAVKTRLHRARLLLRAKLSDYWQDDSEN